jgi:exodeoxyribonuclease V alpha subunit
LSSASAEDASWLLGQLKASTESNPITFISKGVGGLLPGRVVQVEGFWDKHPRYGNQFLIETCIRSELPRERAALVRYLVANVAGLGKRRSEQLIAALGETVLMRIKQEPDLVKRIFPGGIGERIALGVRQWLVAENNEQWSIEIAPKLMAAGDINYSQAKRIISYFSSAEVADLIAHRDPYRLLEIPGIGWHRADAIAQNMGIAPDADERLEAAVQCTYQEELRRGNSAVLRSQLISATARLVPGLTKQIGRAVARSTIYCELVRSRGVIFRPDVLQLEWSVADLINKLLRRRFSLEDRAAHNIQQILKREGANEAQKQAVWTALKRGVSIITGGPGTGKTHTLRALAKASYVLGVNLRIAAPTGKAAMRAAELCQAESITIHKLIGGVPGSLRQGGPIESGILVIEEASMIDLALMSWLSSNIRPENSFRLVLVGDCNQLPPINHGQVLSDLLLSNKVPTTKLTEIQRQSAGSAIIFQANRILKNQPLDEVEQVDWRLVELPEDVQKAQKAFTSAVRCVVQEEHTSIIRKVERMTFNPRRDLQVLSPRNTGPLGVTELNAVLRKELNRSSEVGPWIGGGERVRIGDRVVCTQNDYTIGERGLMNGEQGVVTEVTIDTITVRLDDGRVIKTRGIQNSNLRLAFCMSVHRSQGSEYPVVVVVYHSSHYPLLDKRLLYTAITRSRSRAILCADRKALALSALSTTSQIMRVTRLASRIIGTSGKP